jgi:hypothetical protein
MEFPLLHIFQNVQCNFYMHGYCLEYILTYVKNKKCEVRQIYNSGIYAERSEAEKSVYVLGRLFGKILLGRLFGNLIFIYDFLCKSYGRPPRPGPSPAWLRHCFFKNLRGRLGRWSLFHMCLYLLRKFCDELFLLIYAS